jgi:hypothetical protein
VKIEDATQTMASLDQGQEATGPDECWDIYQALQSDIIESIGSEHGVLSRPLSLPSPSLGPIAAPFIASGTSTGIEPATHPSSQVSSAPSFSSACSTQSYIAEERRRSGLNFVTKQVGNQEVLVFGGPPLVEVEGEGEGEVSTMEEEQAEAEVDISAVMARLGYNASFTVPVEPLPEDVTSASRKDSMPR